MSLMADVEGWIAKLWMRGTIFAKGALAQLKADIPGLEHDAVGWLEAELGKIVTQVDAQFVAADGQLKWNTAMLMFEAALKTAGGDLLALLNNQGLRDTLLQDAYMAVKAGLIAAALP